MQLGLIIIVVVIIILLCKSSSEAIAVVAVLLSAGVLLMSQPTTSVAAYPTPCYAANGGGVDASSCEEPYPGAIDYNDYGAAAGGYEARETANYDRRDGDERMTHQARGRNDPERVIAGTMKRREKLDKYLREEVDEEENKVWWGADDY
jgi:hypothetical protein